MCVLIGTVRIARGTETTLPAALIIAQHRQVLHTAPQDEILKSQNFPKMGSLFGHRTPMHSLASLSMQVERGSSQATWNRSGGVGGIARRPLAIVLCP